MTRAGITRPWRAAALCGALSLGLASFVPAAAQDEAAGGAIPRMTDGHPDMSGVWWTGGDVGGAGFESSNPRDPNAPPAPSFTDLYTPDAAAHAASLSDENDPTLGCKPTAFGTLNVRLFDVGAVGQIIAKPDMVVQLQETFHGYQTIPTDGRPHRDNIPPSYRGDAVGHWEDDTFVVEVTNFTDDTWIWAEGRVSPHSDALRVVERYTLTDADTMVIDATVYDDKVLTEPWHVPTQTLVRAPFDQLLPLICSNTETQAVMDAAAALNE
jgi:hypothetical protein